MTIRFVYEGAVGFLTLLLVLLLGEKGGAAFVLYAFLPLVMRTVKRRKPDERELHLFYRTGNISMGMTFVILVVVYFLARVQSLSALIAANWLFLTVAAILLVHSVVGLVVFHSDQSPEGEGGLPQ
jgi:hypothetical protein